MKTQHWIYSFAENNLGCDAQLQCVFRPSSHRAMSSGSRPNLAAIFKSSIRGLHPICGTDGRFIGHA